MPLGHAHGEAIAVLFYAVVRIVYNCLPLLEDDLYRRLNDEMDDQKTPIARKTNRQSLNLARSRNQQKALEKLVNMDPHQEMHHATAWDMTNSPDCDSGNGPIV